MTSLSKKLLFIVIPALVIIMGLLGVLLFLPESGEVFVEQIAEARRLSDSGDYQKAIVYYKKAIEKDDTQEDPYIELANIYFLLNMREEGLKVLRDGIKKTNSMRIIETLNDIENTGENQIDSMEKLVNEGVVTFNSTYTDAFANYNFEKYTNECTVKREQSAADMYSVIYEQYDATFEYVNNADNVVLDPSTGKPYPYARPTSIRMNSLSQLIQGIEQGVSVNELEECGASQISVKPFDKQLDTCIVTFEYKGLSFALGCDEEGNVKDEKAYNNIVPKPGQGEAADKVTSKGKIIDSTTGKNVSGVTLKFRAGKDNRDGDVAAEEKTREGEYSVELEPGDYTVEIIADGYNREYFSLYVSDSDSDTGQTISISPSLASNEIRFVLEWGATPTDLDSHLTGECRTGKGRSININWMNTKAFMDGNPIAELDIDDRNGFGPETTTLYDTNGTYTYRVHRFSSVGSLAQSGATVKIYSSNSSSPIVVRVPNDAGEWWTVCKVENGEIIDINGITE